MSCLKVYEQFNVLPKSLTFEDKFDQSLLFSQMKTVEIRYIRKALIIITILLTALFFAINYFVFFSGKDENSGYVKLIEIAGMPVLAYTIYVLIKRIRNNKPVLVLTEHFLEIDQKGKPIILSWIEIKSFVIKNNDDGYHLILTTSQDEKKVQLNWLEKSPAQIESLMNTYHRK